MMSSSSSGNNSRRTAMIMRYRDKPCNTAPHTHTAAADGGDDSTVESSTVDSASQFAVIYSESHDDDNGPANHVGDANSYESRDSTTTSSGGGSDDTERASNKKPSAAARAAAATNDVAFATMSALSVDDMPEEEEEFEGEIEVRKEDGATELYLLVETARWDEVCDRIQENPDEAKIWVTSSGKDSSHFWDVWRRLPIHEACRRQPPPVVIYGLLEAYPASSHIESNFGELPLHAAVRCGACAEVVNCILAAYPAAVFERDNSGCTPLDILNGTGRIMDHDAVIAALNRTTRFLTKEENLFNWKVRQLESNFNDDKEEQTRKFERMIRERDTEIEELKRQLQQEKLATSNLALKVIQSEKVLQQKIVLDRRLGKMEGELLDLNAANSSRKTKITELEEIIVSDRKTIMALTEVIETLRLQLTAICEEEEQFVADNLAQAEANLKAMFENQYVFLKETGKRKKLMRERLSRLGISLSASMSEEDEEEGGECGDEEPAEEPSDDEVARLALQSAMQAVKPLIQHEED